MSVPTLNILIAGGSGFVGRYLTNQFQQQNHAITLLTRQANCDMGKVTLCQWDGKSVPDSLQNNFDVIINLCGFNIAAKRWSSAVKQQLRDSRLQPTQALVDFLQAKPAIKPIRFINASAIGYYPSSEQEQSEGASFNKDQLNFCQQLAQEWEACAQQASCDNVKVIITRFGVVLGQGGGMLQKLMPSFKFGLGMIMGDKEAYLSWVHIHDLYRAIDWLMSHDNTGGAYNLTAPQACNQTELANALAKALHRPRLLHMPNKAIQIIFGELGNELLLANQRIVPKRLLDDGFVFDFKSIDQAFNNLINNT